jgi:thiamine-phosphate pyrophosphorylase
MLSLMLVTQKQTMPLNHYLEFIEQCIHGGVSSVQLREKNHSEKELLHFGRALLECLKPYNIPLIVNDSVILAKKLNAQGVHLGQSDGCPTKARAYLGSDSVIGVSVSNIAQMQQSYQHPIDYLGIGPVFPTQNKKNASAHCGVYNLAHLVKQSKLPCIAIGGISTDNIAQVLATNVQGVAVIAALHNSKNIAASCQKLLLPNGVFS